MLVLGIETTCDETAAALVERDADGNSAIIANIVLSQIADHAAFGGVVPEIAARAHVEALDVVIATAMADAGKSFAALDGVAAAAGPGLIGGVIVGLTTGKAIALVHEKPLIAVNHLEAHALTARLTDGIPFPYCLFLASGGHTQIVAVCGVGDYVRLGTTRDDAIGEAFDKTAKLLGLGYPGGPQVEREAEHGDRGRFLLPRPMIGRHDAVFSLSGLKTAVRLEAEKIAPLSQGDVADLCASFQFAVIEMVVDRLHQGLRLFRQRFGTPTALVAAGGVAANHAIREALLDVALQHQLLLAVPPVALCGDNAAIVAWAGAERLAHGLCDTLDVAPRPRWPLEEVTKPVTRTPGVMPAPRGNFLAALAEAGTPNSFAASLAERLETDLAAVTRQVPAAPDIGAQEGDAVEGEPQQIEPQPIESPQTEPQEQEIEARAAEPSEIEKIIEPSVTGPPEGAAPLEIGTLEAGLSQVEGQVAQAPTAEAQDLDARSDPENVEELAEERTRSDARFSNIDGEFEPQEAEAQEAEKARAAEAQAGKQPRAEPKDAGAGAIEPKVIELPGAEPPMLRPRQPSTAGARAEEADYTESETAEKEALLPETRFADPEPQDIQAPEMHTGRPDTEANEFEGGSMAKSATKHPEADPGAAVSAADEAAEIGAPAEPRDTERAPMRPAPPANP